MKNIKLLFLAIALSFSFWSCDSFLDEQPVSEVPAENMWQTPRDAKAGINEIYGQFRATMRENYFYWGDFRSDSWGAGAPSQINSGLVISNMISTDHSSALWTKLFQMINQANLAIKYIPGISMPSTTERNDLVGQAYAMRALGYLYAIRVWGDVPLFTEPNEKYGEHIFRERTDMNYILSEVIIPDLQMAERLMDRTGNKERKRISIFGVWAIMADAYMWKKDYNMADQTIAKMDGSTFVAFEPSIDTWRKMMVEELNGKASDNTPENDEYTTKELIFVSHFNMDEVGTNGYSYMYQWFTGSGNRAVVLSQTLLNKFDQTNDKRFALSALNYQEGWELNKFIGGKISTTLNKTCEVAYPIYRYSDMVLLRAEAQVHLGKWDEALDLVKKVRDRAGLSTPLASSFVSEDQLIDYILDERQRELLGEGRRWFDLVRTNRWKQVMEPINGMKVDGNELFPIHYSHIRQNTKLVQNSYYGGK